MRRRLWCMLTAMMVFVSFLQLQAQVPYLPKKATLGTTLASGDFSTFAPQGDYTLEAAMEAEQSIDVRNEYSLGFVYKAKSNGMHRFVVQGSNVYVFNDGTYIETLTDYLNADPALFPDLFSEADDATAKTGIYQEANLFKNPGFEEGDTYSSHSGVRFKPADWFIPEVNNVATSCRVHDIYANGDYEALRAITEGQRVLMMHGNVIPLGQKMDNLKPGTWYKATWRQMPHKDTNPPIAYAAYLAKDPTGPVDDTNAYSVYNYHALKGGYGDKIDVTYCFRTPDVLPEPLYFVIKRTGDLNCLQHYDRMTLVEANPITNGLTISGVSEVKYENAAVIPATLAEGQGYDFTHLVLNPNMDYSKGWISTTSSWSNTLAYNQTGDFSETFWENWDGGNFAGKVYQVVTGLPNGEYTLKAAAFAEQEGAGFYLYANDKKTPANTKVPTFQTVNFTVLDGTAEIGIVAEQATNQWIGLDNVRLYYYGYGDTYLTEALAALAAAMEEATALQTEKVGTADRELLGSVLAQATLAKDSADTEALDVALTTLNQAIAEAKGTIAVYASLNDAIALAETNKVDYAEFPGYADFEAAIVWAQGVYDTAEADRAAVAVAITDLQQAEKTCRFTQATPFDASFLIVNPNFASGFTGWKQANIPETSNEYKVAEFNGKFVWNSWSNNFTKMDVYQVLKNVPAGIYKLSGRTATDGIPHDQHLYAKTSTGTAVSPAAELLTGGNSGRPFATPWEELETTEFIVSADGEIRIGMASTSGGGTSGWFCVTDFELTCLSLAGAPEAPVPPKVPEFQIPAEVKPVLTGDYVIYHPASKKFLANSTNATYVALNDFDFIQDVDAYAWNVAVSGDGNDNIQMKQFSSGQYANTSLVSWNDWDMVFDSLRADAWLLKDVQGGYMLSSLVKSTNKVVGVDKLDGNPLSIYIDKRDADNPVFQFIDKETFFAIPEIVEYCAQLDVYNAEYAEYLPKKTFYDARNALVEALEEAATYLSVDSVSYTEEGIAAFTDMIDVAKALYLNEAATLEEIQEMTAALKDAQYDYRVAVIASAENPVDFTFLIVNPTFDDLSGWISATDAQNKGLATENPNREIAFNGKFLENWKPLKIGDGKIYQTISGLPKGKYIFKLAAFSVTADTKEGVYVYANESESLVKSIDPAYYEVEVNVMEGTLEIGLRIEAGMTNWVGIDNASIKFCGNKVGVLVKKLTEDIANAEAMTDVMQTSVAENLAAVVEDGKAKANESSTVEELEAAIAALAEAVEKANVSIAAYKELDAAVAAAGASVVAAEPEVVAAIQAVVEVYREHAADEARIAAAIKTLKSLVNATIVANAVNGDVTILIANPTIEQVASIKTRPVGWENSMNQGTNGNFTKLAGTEAEPVDTYFEVWNSNVSTIVFDYNQVLTNIPQGVYVLKAATFTENSTANAVLYGNTTTTPMKFGVNGENFKNDGEVNTELTVIVTDDTLRLGIKTIGTLAGGPWSGADNFRLIYRGTETDLFAALQQELADSLDVAEELKAHASALIVKAEMNKLDAAIVASTAAKESTDIEELDAVIAPLKEAIAAANTSIGLCNELIVLFGEATALIERFKDQVDPTALQTVLTKNQNMYENQTDETDNTVLAAGKAEIEAAIVAYEESISIVGVGEIGADEVKVYVKDSSIVVEGADYTIYTLGGIPVPNDAQLVPGVYLVKVAGQTVKVQVK